MNKVKYCIPTLNRFDHLRTAIERVNNGTRIPDEIVIIDNSGNGGAIIALQDILEKYTNIYILPQTYNLGVSKSWNTFMTMYSDDYVIIANDDVFPHAQAIHEIIRVRDIQTQDHLFFGSSTSGNAFSFFSISNQAFEHIGPFDEKFNPAYHEDADFARRAILLGYRLVMLPSVTYDHIGSATIAAYDTQRMQEHHAGFVKLQQYYREKWGGMPGQEVYKTPFNK